MQSQRYTRERITVRATTWPIYLSDCYGYVKLINELYYAKVYP